MQLFPKTVLAFVHIEKCGGTTLIDSLRRTYLLNHVDVIPQDKKSMLFCESDLKRLLWLRPRLISVSGHSIRIQSNLESIIQDVIYFTCLRDPILRYLSEYYYFVERIGMAPCFQAWLDRTERHNFQTRSIAGNLDVELAKRVLDEKFAVVGVLEEFEDFFNRLTFTTKLATGSFLCPIHGVLNARSPRPSLPSPRALLDQYGDSIHLANAKDIELYRHVISSTIPRQRHQQPIDEQLVDYARMNTKSSWISHIRAGASLVFYRSYRNLIYKPYMGRLPIPHALPEYEQRRIAS